MGEKEIKPATPGDGVKTTSTTPESGGGASVANPGTRTRPGTGGVEKKTPPPPPTKSGYTGSDTYDDGFTMGREADGSTYLKGLDGTRADWDPDSGTWKGPDGQQKGDDWSGGHRPTDFQTGQSGRS